MNENGHERRSVRPLVHKRWESLNGEWREYFIAASQGTTFGKIDDDSSERIVGFAEFPLGEPVERTPSFDVFKDRVEDAAVYVHWKPGISP